MQLAALLVEMECRTGGKIEENINNSGLTPKSGPGELAGGFV